jgi:hypothetical protein
VGVVPQGCVRVTISPDSSAHGLSPVMLEVCPASCRSVDETARL